MLVAITTEFLLFNLLAFANNVLELTGAYGHSQLETVLVEVSTERKGYERMSERGERAVYEESPPFIKSQSVRRFYQVVKPSV